MIPCMFELSQLRCFIAVAEEGHFGRAALRLHMTQPPLSRQIQILETTLGVSLINRSNRVVSLTPAGRSFLNDARRIIKLSEEARLSVRRIASGTAGALAIGFIPATSYELLPRLVSAAAVELPGIELVLKELVTADQLDGLSTRRLDVGILRLPVDQDRLETLRVSRDPMLLAVPEGHPFETEAEVPIERLQGQALVMYAPVESRYHHDLLSAAFRRAGILPNFVQYARETHTILALVGAGVGLAVVPESSVRLRPPNVHIRPLVGPTRLVSELSMVWLRDNDNPALPLFQQFVRRHIATA
ncbi:transcriptional regulator [Aliidongia dinghuensis]|uniref:Transcriptional regulator n=2 Tax=Aliidongia dinghuensis TaxID=1867774 RepID=A0A8J3E2Q3_9PROT|nr:transcriptional regulator [Aliidongia dinghuensis]